MRLPRIQSRRRAGFTLIELLVVIAIIAVLVSLLGAGIFYAYTRMNETGATSDISNLSAAMQAFKAKYKVYPPQRIRLCSNWYQYYPAAGGTSTPAALGGPALDDASVAFLARVWPELGTWGSKGPNATGFVMDWSGTGSLIDEILDGDQVLVFFLGGIPFTAGTNLPTASNGFASNGKNPTLQGANVGRDQTFFNFPSGRLFFRTNPALANTPSKYFPSFADYFGQGSPYLYFSGHNIKNGYNPYPNVKNPNGQGFPMIVTNAKGFNQIVIPYYKTNTGVTPVQYQNPDSFQIMCAGRDGNFNGVVTASGAYPNAFRWPPAAYLSLEGKDDMTNFSSGNLEAGQ